MHKWIQTLGPDSKWNATSGGREISVLAPHSRCFLTVLVSAAKMAKKMTGNGTLEVLGSAPRSKSRFNVVKRTRCLVKHTHAMNLYDYLTGGKTWHETSGGRGVLKLHCRHFANGLLSFTRMLLKPSVAQSFSCSLQNSLCDVDAVAVHAAGRVKTTRGVIFVGVLLQGWMKTTQSV